MKGLDAHQIAGCYVVIGMLLLYASIAPLVKQRRPAGSETATAETLSIGRGLVLFAGLAFLAVGLRALMAGY